MSVVIVRFCSTRQASFVLDDESPRILYSGAFGAGKTRGVCHKTLRLLVRFPRSTGGLFRKTARSLRPTTLDTFLRILPREYLLDHNKSEQLVTLRNGSRLFYFGLDDPDKIGSLELGFAGIDEAIETTLDDWMMLEGRVGRDGIVPPPGQLFAATNPGSPNHYLYDLFFTKGLGRVVETRTIDNRLLPASYAARLGIFTGPFFERYVKGRWLSFEGLVYEAWNPLVHVVDPFPIPEEWPRWRAIDFGFTNPFSCLWFALSPEDELFVYRELYGTRKLVSEWAKEIRDLSTVEIEDPDDSERKKVVPERFVSTFADHDAEDRATLEAEGIVTDPAEKAVRPGIEAVCRRLSAENEKGKPRLFLFRNSLVYQDEFLAGLGRPTRLAEEFQSYSWHRGGDGKPDRDAPIKLNDHALDALRYGIAGIDPVYGDLPVPGLLP